MVSTPLFRLIDELHQARLQDIEGIRAVAFREDGCSPQIPPLEGDTGDIRSLDGGDPLK